MDGRRCRLAGRPRVEKPLVGEVRAGLFLGRGICGSGLDRASRCRSPHRRADCPHVLYPGNIGSLQVGASFPATCRFSLRGSSPTLVGDVGKNQFQARGLQLRLNVPRYFARNGRRHHSAMPLMSQEPSCTPVNRPLLLCPPTTTRQQQVEVQL